MARLLSLRSAMALDPLVPTLPERHTRIVCTIGPASVDILPALINAGMDCARINCAHGDAQYYTHVVSAVRAACASVAPGGTAPAAAHRPDARHVAIAFDVKGPEVRTGAFGATVAAPAGRPAGTSKEIAVRKGTSLTLTADPALAAAGTQDLVFINYPQLATSVSVGQLVVIDDGNVELRVTAIDAPARRVTVVALTDAPIGEHKGVNLPGVRSLDLPLVTAKDSIDIALAARLGADYIFASFVQSAAHVHAVRQVVADATEAAGAQHPARIIAKIENEAGLDRFDEILAAADGIMVARGDLGVQIAPERVFLAQKMMVARCNAAGKPVICATQMLESMTTHPRPTRAEVTDVATAVLDGADAVMLSGETAKGAFPLEATAAMSAIASAGELAFPTRAFFNELSEEVADGHARTAAAAAAAVAKATPSSSASMPPPPVDVAVEYEVAAADGALAVAEPRISNADTETICASAVLAALDVRSPAILVLSRTGRTAAALAKFRPPCPIVTLTTDPAVARRLKLVRGVQSVLVPAGQVTAAMRAGGLSLVRRLGWTRPGDRVVVVAGAGVLWLEGGVHVSIVTV